MQVLTFSGPGLSRPTVISNPDFSASAGQLSEWLQQSPAAIAEAVKAVGARARSETERPRVYRHADVLALCTHLGVSLQDVCKQRWPGCYVR